MKELIERLEGSSSVDGEKIGKMLGLIWAATGLSSYAGPYGEFERILEDLGKKARYLALRDLPYKQQQKALAIAKDIEQRCSKL